MFYAASIIGNGVSYDAGSGDALTLVTAPVQHRAHRRAHRFTVTALGCDLKPAGAVTVTYRVQSGTAKLACGSSSCTVATGGDGSANMNVTAVDGTKSVVVASLTDGASLNTNFTGGTPPTLAALTPSLSIAAGATATWTTQALVLKSGAPQSGRCGVAGGIGNKRGIERAGNVECQRDRRQGFERGSAERRQVGCCNRLRQRHHGLRCVHRDRRTDRIRNRWKR